MAKSTNYTGDDYDFVAFFDCFHDMSDPSETSSHVLLILRKKDGIWMLVEPFANDKLEDNLNPLEGYSIQYHQLIVPASLRKNGPALGTQAGEQRRAEIIKSAGFQISVELRKLLLIWCLRQSIELSFR